MSIFDGLIERPAGYRLTARDHNSIVRALRTVISALGLNTTGAAGQLPALQAFSSLSVALLALEGKRFVDARIISHTGGNAPGTADTFKYTVALLDNGHQIVDMVPRYGRPVQPDDTVTLIHPAEDGMMCVVVRNPGENGDAEAELMLLPDSEKLVFGNCPTSSPPVATVFDAERRLVIPIDADPQFIPETFAPANTGGAAVSAPVGGGSTPA